MKKEEKINIKGVIKFDVEEDLTSTIIIAGNRKWKLTKQMLDTYVLMDEEGKIADFNSSYRKAYERSLQVIYDVIINDINSNFNVMINMEDRD